MNGMLLSWVMSKILQFSLSITLNFLFFPDHDFTEQDVENVIKLVFCSCDSDGDFQLNLDEYLGPVCEV